MTKTRRSILLAGTGALAGAGWLALAGRARLSLPAATAAEATQHWEVEHSAEEWRRLLDAEQYAVLRQADTERAFSSPLNHEKRKGIFCCAGCKLELFSSATKFDSGTGWPSFYEPLPHAVGTTEDRSFGMTRTAVHCRRCGGHLGHVFDDGPPPTGLRYCMNGVALVFVPEGKSS